MRIYIIRHGQSTNCAGFPRTIDPPLSPLGEQQSLLLAQALVNAGLTAIYSSPMRVALATAYRIGEASGLTVSIDPVYCEAGGLEGHPGLSRREIAFLFPSCKLADSIHKSGWWDGEEDVDHVQVRVQSVAESLHTLEPEDSESRIAVVTHATFASYLIRELIAVAPGSQAQFTHRNTGVTLFERDLGVFSLRFLNRTEHLPDHLVT